MVIVDFYIAYTFVKREWYATDLYEHDIQEWYKKSHIHHIKYVN